MKPIDELLEQYELTHGTLCPGQLLGIRMALLGCRQVGIEDPHDAGRKKLIVWIEIDRWLADAVEAVTGARLGKRTLKFLDYGKLAATFLNLETGKAVRIVALEASRCLADERYPKIESKHVRQMTAYREATDEELFAVNVVEVRLSEMDGPGHPHSRVICAKCGEGVNDGREVSLPDGPLCRTCAFGAAYHPGIYAYKKSLTRNGDEIPSAGSIWSPKPTSRMSAGGDPSPETFVNSDWRTLAKQLYWDWRNSDTGLGETRMMTRSRVDRAS